MEHPLREMLLTPCRSPVSLRMSINTLARSDPTFRAAASALFPEMLASGDTGVFIQNLVACGMVEFFVADPELLEQPTAIAVALEAGAIDPALAEKIARSIADSDASIPLPRTFRLLEILAELVEAKPRWATSMLAGHPDARVRSRAALVLNRHTCDVNRLREHLNDNDARVRANAVETMWSRLTPECLVPLREAAKDPDNRVQGNALVGLYRLSDERVSESIVALANHQDPVFRSTGAWVMGETGDAAFVPALEQMARSETGAPRWSALRALSRLRRADSGDKLSA